MKEICASVTSTTSDVTDSLVGATHCHQLRPSSCMEDTEQTNASNHPSRRSSITEAKTECTDSCYECIPHETHEQPPLPSSGILVPRLQVETTPPIQRFPSPSQFQVNRPSNTITPLSPSTASSLSVSGPLNVLIFGETGVGKSSVINLIMRQDVAQTSGDAQTCTLEHTAHQVTLDGRQYKLWEVSSIASMGFFQRLFKRWMLKKKYKKLHKENGVYLLLYCIRRGRAEGTLIKDYKFFTSIVGSTANCAPNIAAVVTCLEDYPGDMDDWWKKNEQNLEKSGMRFSKHICITSLPHDQQASAALRARRCRSELVIRQLLCDSYRPGTSEASVDSIPGTPF